MFSKHPCKHRVLACVCPLENCAGLPGASGSGGDSERQGVRWDPSARVGCSALRTSLLGREREEQDPPGFSLFVLSLFAVK